VRVHDVRAPGAHEGTYAARSAEIPIGAHRYSGCRHASRSQSLKKRRVRHADDEGFVSPIAQALREQQHLPLPASPLPAGVDV
jgi:hypothetical protein